MQSNRFSLKQFVVVVLITSIWINASEVFRYFVFVMPQMQTFWQGANKPLAVMTPTIFMIWGLWDTLLTAILVLAVWLFAKAFGPSLKQSLVAATFVWAAVFVIFWVAASNMGLADWAILWVALPLSWAELAVGAFITQKLYATGRWAG